MQCALAEAKYFDITTKHRYCQAWVCVDTANIYLEPGIFMCLVNL